MSPSRKCRGNHLKQQQQVLELLAVAAAECLKAAAVVGLHRTGFCIAQAAGLGHALRWVCHCLDDQLCC